jgi:hypothetical protein
MPNAGASGKQRFVCVTRTATRAAGSQRPRHARAEWHGHRECALFLFAPLPWDGAVRPAAPSIRLHALLMPYRYGSVIERKVRRSCSHAWQMQTHRLAASGSLATVTSRQAIHGKVETGQFVQWDWKGSPAHRVNNVPCGYRIEIDHQSALISLGQVKRGSASPVACGKPGSHGNPSSRHPRETLAGTRKPRHPGSPASKGRVFSLGGHVDCLFLARPAGRIVRRYAGSAQHAPEVIQELGAYKRALDEDAASVRNTSAAPQVRRRCAQ